MYNSFNFLNNLNNLIFMFCIYQSRKDWITQFKRLSKQNFLFPKQWNNVQNNVSAEKD